jgi:hypothetical protein
MLSGVFKMVGLSVEYQPHGLVVSEVKSFEEDSPYLARRGRSPDSNSSHPPCGRYIQHYDYKP